MLQPVGIRPQVKKMAKINVRPQAKKMARCREQQGEENGEDARPRVKNPSMVNIPKIPRGSAGPTLKALHRRKESIMQAKNNLDSKQELLDQEMADVVKAIAVNTKMLVKKSLLTVKKEGEESEEVEEEDYDAKEEEEEEDNVKEEEEETEMRIVKEEEEETEMCNGFCTVWSRKWNKEVQICDRPCNLGPCHPPDHHCHCRGEHFKDPDTGDLKVKEYEREWRDSESKRRHRKIPAPPPFPKWRCQRHLGPVPPPFPPPGKAYQESAEGESAVPGLGPAQAGEEFAGEKSSEVVCGREEQDEENKHWQDADASYAMMWFEQNGDDSGIPKEYTPCKFHFKAQYGCRTKKCQFSHKGIFHEEPFTALLKNITWQTCWAKQTRKIQKHR
jgi:hypothetical protein